MINYSGLLKSEVVLKKGEKSKKTDGEKRRRKRKEEAERKFKAKLKSGKSPESWAKWVSP